MVSVSRRCGRWLLEGSFEIFLSQSRVGEWVVFGGLVEKEVSVMKALLSFLEEVCSQ